MNANSGPLLDIADLSLVFQTDRGRIHALDKVSLLVARGECVALIGESGSGKSITGLAIMRMHAGNAEVTARRLALGDVDIQAIPEKQLRQYRGRRVAMIFQNAKSALNPIRRVGDTLVDILLAHARQHTSRAEARKHVLVAMEQVGIVRAKERMDAYPSELSGGMCQRIMIVAALICNPEIIIADEPTSALDVTTQERVMTLLISACRQRGVACLFITHDLALAARYCDRAVVMHAGQVLENGPTQAVLGAPAHPYTRMLVESLPYGKRDYTELRTMEGSLHDLRRDDLPACRFAERCPSVQERCRYEPSPSVLVGPQHAVVCHLHHAA